MESKLVTTVVDTSDTLNRIDSTFALVYERIAVDVVVELVLDFVEVTILTNDPAIPCTEWKSHTDRDTSWKVRRLRSFKHLFLGLELQLFEYSFRQRDFDSWCEALVQWLPDPKRLAAYALPNPQFLCVTEWCRKRFPHWTLDDVPWYPIHQNLWSELKHVHSTAEPLWTHLFQYWHFSFVKNLFGFDASDKIRLRMVCTSDDQRNIWDTKVPEGGIAGFQDSYFYRMMKSNKWDMKSLVLHILESAGLWFLKLIRKHGQNTFLRAEEILTITRRSLERQSAVDNNSSRNCELVEWFLDLCPSESLKHQMLALCSPEATLLILASLPKRPYLTSDCKEHPLSRPLLYSSSLRSKDALKEPLSYEEQDLLCRFYWQDWIAMEPYHQFTIPPFVVAAICKGLISHERVHPLQWFNIQFCLMLHGRELDCAFVDTKEDLFAKGGQPVTSQWTGFWRAILHGAVFLFHPRSFKRMAAVKRVDGENTMWQKPWLWSIIGLGKILSPELIHALLDIGFWPSDLEGSISFVQQWANELTNLDSPAIAWRNLFFTIYVVRSRWNFPLDHETALKIGWHISIPKDLRERLTHTVNSTALHLLHLSGIVFRE